MILQNQDDDDDDGLMWKTCHTPTNLGDGFCLSGDFIADAVYGQQVGLQDQGLSPAPAHSGGEPRLLLVP